IWSAYQAGIISWLALKIWCAAWIIQKSRCKQKKDGTPYRFQQSEVYAYFKKIAHKECDEALQELEAANLLRISDTEIWFAASLDDIKNEQVKTRATVMFDQLHENNRDKRMKFPKRLLRLIIRCGQQVVRVATMLGLLLRIMLVKRYNDYRGCVKAEWIASLFGVSRHRVNTERAKLIKEGIFRRLPSPQWVKNKYGEWVVLGGGEAEPTAPVENSAEASEKLEPPPPENLPKVGAPDLNQIPSSSEEVLRNQEIAPSDPPREGKTGASQQHLPTQPTWNNITLEDLRDDVRSERLREEAIQRGHLKDTEPDQINFFAGIAHALRVAKSNACGLLRTIVEKGLWHVISQADEYNGIRRIRRTTEDQETQHAAQACKAFFTVTPAEEEETQGTEHPIAVSQDQEAQHAAQVCKDFFSIAPAEGEETQVEEQPIALSEDAITFQAYTRTFERTRITDGTLQSIQEHGYLLDWTRERWENAEIELAHARLVRARQQYGTMDTTGMQDMMREDVYEDDDEPFDW
ncbi:MAG: hypothetical protein V3U27_18040, partial [Candidatus Tectomicrobia bacterium]